MPDPTPNPVGQIDFTTPKETERQRRRQFRDRVRRLFNEHPEVRADAVEALKDAWAYDLPSFSLEELANQPAENCTIAAARRDGHKEVLAWLFSL